MEDTPETSDAAVDGDAETGTDDAAVNGNAAARPGGDESAEERRPTGTETDQKAKADDRELYTETEDQTAFYEWIGGISAGMGIFMTPVLAGPFAVYCALQIRREKPLSAIMILGVVLGTGVFWIFALFFVIL